MVPSPATAHEQEEKLIEKFNLAKNRMVRNRLIWVTILNVLTFLTIIVAMAYYEWIWVYVVFKKGRFDQYEQQFWVNLLYIRADSPEAKYEGFRSAETRMCQNDIYCSAIVYEFEFVGYISFGVFVVGGILQLYDFVRMIYYVVKSGKVLEGKDNFRHIVTIATYFIGLSLSAFSIQVIQPDQSAYGVSFWICVGTLCAFVVVIIYEQISIRKMIKQSLITDLIEKEKKIRAEQIKTKNIQMSYEISIDEGQLTL